MIMELAIYFVSFPMGKILGTFRTKCPCGKVKINDERVIVLGLYALKVECVHL